MTNTGEKSHVIIFQQFFTIYGDVYVHNFLEDLVPSRLKKKDVLWSIIYKIGNLQYSRDNVDKPKPQYRTFVGICSLVIYSHRNKSILFSTRSKLDTRRQTVWDNVDFTILFVSSMFYHTYLYYSKYISYYTYMNRYIIYFDISVSSLIIVTKWDLSHCLEACPTFLSYVKWLMVVRVKLKICYKYVWIRFCYRLFYKNFILSLYILFFILILSHNCFGFHLKLFDYLCKDILCTIYFHHLCPELF